jgi:hypothetical protein
MFGYVNEEKKLRSKLICNMGYNTADSFSKKFLNAKILVFSSITSFSIALKY